MTAAVDPVLAEHARSLLKLARLFDAIGASDSFTRLARDWPYPGERATTPDGGNRSLIR